MIFFIVFVISIILFQILKTINLKIEFENVKLQLPKINKKILNKDSKISLKIYLLKNLKIYEIDLKKIKVDNQNMKNRINKIRSKGSKKDFNLIVINILKKEIFSIEKMNLKIFEGTEDAAITAIGIGIISTIIGNILKNKITNFEAQRFEIIPIYENKNLLKIELNGIFSIKFANIKDIIKHIIRKRRVENNDRTSNRRTYAYSNE